MGTGRNFSPYDRLSIVRVAEREGRLETIRKYALAPSLFDRWRQKYLTGGVDGLKNAHRLMIERDLTSYRDFLQLVRGQTNSSQ